LKKIVVILCLILLVSSIEVFGESNVTVNTFPTKIYVKAEESEFEINIMANDILNYMGKSYVPLRLFTECLGAGVKFAPKNKEVEYNVISIYIKSKDDFASSIKTDIDSSPSVKKVNCVIFPCKVNICIADYNKELNLLENEVISYNNITYVPLRTLSESLGFRLDFKASQSSNECNIITLAMPSEIDIPYSDDDGLLNFSVNYKEILKDNNTYSEKYYEASGLIRVNEDIPEDKYVVIDILDQDENIIGYFNISIDKIETQPLKKGELRYFVAKFDTKPCYYYKARICDRLE